MAKRTYTVTAGGERFELRLTLGGQRALRRQFEEETLQTVLGAAADSERMAAVLQQALCWEGNRNSIRDGEVFYDFLVDCGWSGQEDFGALAFDLAAESGLISREQAKKLKQAVLETVQQAFEELSGNEEEDENGPFDGN